MKRPEDLSRDELLAIVTAVRNLMYLSVDDAGNDVFDPDQNVEGADLVEDVAFELERYGLVPAYGPVAGGTNAE